MNQATCASKPQTLELDCTFDKSLARRHEISCLTYTWPDLFGAVAIFSRVTAKTFEINYIKLANKYVVRSVTLRKRGLWKH